MIVLDHPDRIAAEHPDRIALTSSATSLTYFETVALTNRIPNAMIAAGCEPVTPPRC